MWIWKRLLEIILLPLTVRSFNLASCCKLEKIVNDWLNNDSSDGLTKGGQSKTDDDDDIITAPKSSPKPAQTKSPKDAKYANLDDAFADLE